MEPALGLDPRDSWGRRREPNGNDDPVLTGSISSQTTRGYTGQEELADISLVHFNGRVYDPLVGRFTSGDPTVQYPTSSQGWNRYAYVGNNPLAFADPSGYGFFSNLFKIFVNPLGPLQFISPLNQATQSFFRDNEIADIALEASSVACGPAIAACAFGTSSYIAGVDGGSASEMFTAGVISGVTAEAFQGIADSGWSTGLKIGVSATVGGLSSVASGGSFQSGFLAAGFSSFAGAVIPSAGPVGNVIIGAVVGGTGSVLGGGKFENGAATGAFSYAVATIATDLAPADDTVDYSTAPPPPGPQIAQVEPYEEDEYESNSNGLDYSDSASTRPQQNSLEGYPSNNGFFGPPVVDTLQPGVTISRYTTSGSASADSGTFFSPAGTPFNARSMPGPESDYALSVYEVVRPIPVLSGPAAPAFGKIGFGTQYQTLLGARALIENGYIRQVQ